MRNIIWMSMFVTPCLCFGSSNRVSDQCSTAKILAQIRPGAVWAMQGDSIKNLKWLDTKQSKPNTSEVEKAKNACIAESEARETRKVQARIEVKNPATPLEKKVDDLILLLDLDK